MTAHDRPLRDAGERVRGGEEVRLGRERQLLASDGRLVLAGELGVELGERLLHAGRIVHVDRGASRQVIEQGPQPAGMEAGQERLHPEERRARVDRVEHLAHPRGRAVHPLRGVAHRGLGRLLALFGEERLARRAEEHLRDVALAALRLRVERTAALDLVAEELEADRRRIRRAPQIDDAAADRERAGVLDERGAGEAERDELRREHLALDRDTLAEEIRARLERAPRDHAPGERACRDHTARTGRRGGEVELAASAAEPLHLHAAIGREVVVREHRVGRDAHHRLAAQEEGDVACERLGLVLVGGDG